MPETRLCDACQAFLQGALTEFEDQHDGYWHHKTADSFQSAQEFGCAICIRLRAAINEEYRQSKHDTYPPSVTGTVLYLDLDPEPHKSHSPYLTVWVAFTVADRSGIPDSSMEVMLLFKPGRASKSTQGNSLISRSTGDDQAVTFVKKQHAKCLALHDKCVRHIGSSPFVPARLIHVGSSFGAMVRLCDSAGSAKSTPRSYAVLSHCWGEVQPLTLTKSSAQELYSGVPLAKLPLTFQHAVLVTRELDLKYLWIDSL